MNDKLFIFQSGWSDWLPSTQYRYDGFIKALRIMYLDGVGGKKFYVGEDVAGKEGVKIGLVNIAAFLAQSMKETIKYDACDENNWDVIDNQYPLSNACGQLEQSYQDYVCPEGEEHMQCEVDPDMEITASTTAEWYGAPGPLFCGPKSKYEFTGYWDYGYVCDDPWADPPKYCTDYPGQRGGRYVNDEPVKNRNNRTDVEGCCWWGRGVIQTTGICNFGKLNYYMGKRAADEGRESAYPDVDFCKDPGIICNSEKHKELKWIAGMFYWITSLQVYNDGWNYMDNLKRFVSSGMSDDTFIDAVSGIVNRGCHDPPCGTGPLDGGYERKENFHKVLEVLFEENGDPKKPSPTRKPTPRPTVEKIVELDETEEIEEEDMTGNESSENQPSFSEGLDESSIGSPTDPPTELALANSDESWVESDEEEEDLASLEHGGGSDSMNLWCGSTQFDATRNCGTGTACPQGICPNGLKCFMISSICGNGAPGSNGDPDDSKEEGTEIIDETESSSPTSPPMNPTWDPTIPPSKGLGSDVTDTYFCGFDRADASASCHKRCRSGSPDECPSGMTCFGYTSCTEEAEEDQFNDTKPPTATGLCATDYIELIDLCWSAEECSETNPCQDEKTCFESVNCELTAGSPPSKATPQNYCARSKEDLETSCNTAETCNAEEPTCAIGTFCFGDYVCVGREEKDELGSSTEVSNNGIQQNYCAQNKAELEKSCFTAKTCNPGDAPCEVGTYCFGDYLCGGDVGTSSPTDIPIEGAPPTSSPTITVTQKILSSSPVSSSSGVEEVKESSSQLLCAASVDELKLSCATAHDCSTGPCPSGMFCFPFSCDTSDNDSGDPTEQVDEETQLSEGNPPEQESNAVTAVCPPNFVGWNSSEGCKVYYECNKGSAGPIFTCGDYEKFDKVRNTCIAESKVNNFCYGPAIVSGDEGQQATERPPGNDDSGSLCMVGYTGWEARPGCQEYYKCENGEAGPIHNCGEGLLFDRELELCNYANSVDCVDKVGPTTDGNIPTLSLSSASLSPTTLAPVPNPPTFSQTYRKQRTQSPTLGVHSSSPIPPAKLDETPDTWSTTLQPTIPKAQSDIPPWLAFSVREPMSGERYFSSRPIVSFFKILILLPVSWYLFG